jgi:hypothetical protein
MPYLAKSRQMTHGIDNVVRCLALRLVYNQRAIVRSGLLLACHF